jgi:hypothetical protein
LPSATATLRSRPRRFVRFTAEPLKRREKSSCDSDNSSISDAPSIPARGRNVSSAVSEANEFHGQTSWEDCPLPRFVISLATGRRTLRRERR